MAPIKETWPELAPLVWAEGSLVRHLAVWLRNAGNVSSVGFFLPACHVEPYSPRLDGEGGRFPRKRWGELVFEGFSCEWSGEILADILSVSEYIVLFLFLLL